MLIKILLVIAIVIQCVATGYALRLVRTTKYNSVWILFIVGFSLLSVERLIQLLLVSGFEVIPRWWFGYLGIVISVCLSIGVMYAHKLFKYIDRLNRQRSLLNKRILTAVLRTEEKARSRFSKELHDGLGPLLSSAKISLSALSHSDMTAEQRDIFNNTLYVVDEALRSLREISNNLSPHALTDFGLARGIQIFVDKAAALHKVKISFATNLRGERYDPDIEVIMYRVVCELITNSLKHSGCSEIRLSLSVAGDTLEMQYSDNGRGFDPQAMPTFLEKLLDQARYSSRPPEILLTHPLPESRLADARNRANQMRPIVVQSSEDFYLAKVRTLGMYNSGRNQLTSDLLDEWAKGNVRQQRAAQYGRALQAMEANKYDEARKTLQPLLAAEPGNAWYLDLATDIDLGQNKANDAINRLKNARDLRTNPVLQLNLANAYLQGGQPQEAANILNRYTFNNKDDSNGWDLLAQAEAALNNRDQELAARAEGYALAGRLDQAISLLSSASSQVKLGSLQQARYDARIDQLRQLQERFKPYTKM